MKRTEISKHLARYRSKSNLVGLSKLCRMFFINYVSVDNNAAKKF